MGLRFGLGLGLGLGLAASACTKVRKHCWQALLVTTT